MTQSDNTACHADNDNTAPALHPVIQRYCESPLLEEQLPLTLKNGFVVDDLSTYCPLCKNTLPAEHTRGKVHQAFGGIVLFDAVGWCEPCNTCVSFNGRLKPYGRAFVIEIVQDGQWVQYAMHEPLRYRVLNAVRDGAAYVKSLIHRHF